MSKPIPSIFKIYFADPSIRTALALMVAPPFFFFFFISQTSGLSAFLQERGPVLLFPVIAFGLSIGSLIWLVLRVTRVISTFKNGINVKGKIISTDYERIRVSDSNSYSSSSRGKKRTLYYITVGYGVGGETYKRELRLPMSPVIYGFKQDDDIDLVVNQDSPKTVYIKNVYLR